MRLVILPVSTKVLEQLFCLPEGYEIVGVEGDEMKHFNFATVRFILSSESLPPQEPGGEIPQAELYLHVDSLPWHPEYRHIVTEVKIP